MFFLYMMNDVLEISNVSRTTKMQTFSILCFQHVWTVTCMKFAWWFCSGSLFVFFCLGLDFCVSFCIA